MAVLDGLSGESLPDNIYLFQPPSPFRGKSQEELIAFISEQFQRVMASADPDPSIRRRGSFQATQMVKACLRGLATGVVDIPTKPEMRTQQMQSYAERQSQPIDDFYLALSALVDTLHLA